MALPKYESGMFRCRRWVGEGQELYSIQYRWGTSGHGCAADGSGPLPVRHLYDYLLGRCKTPKG